MLTVSMEEKKYSQAEGLWPKIPQHIAGYLAEPAMSDERLTTDAAELRRAA